MSTLAEMQDVVRFSKRILPFLENDIDRVRNVLIDICSNINMNVSLARVQSTVFEVMSDENFIDAAGGSPTDIFVCKFQSEGGGTIDLFNDNTPPTWNGGVYVPTFKYGGLDYNGFLFDTSNY